MFLMLYTNTNVTDAHQMYLCRKCYRNLSTRAGRAKILYVSNKYQGSIGEGQKACIDLFLTRKVSLHERKRHTDRSVSSTPYAVLSRGRVHPDLAGGGGVITLAGGYLTWGGVLTLDRGGGVGTPPPIWTQPVYPPPQV